VFSIGDFKVEAGEVAQASGTVMVIVGIVIGICMFISFRKRHKIAVEVRRMSSVVRNSIRRMSGVNIAEVELSNEKRDPNALGADKRQRTFLKDMFNEQERKSVKNSSGIIDPNRRASKYTEVVDARDSIISEAIITEEEESKTEEDQADFNFPG